MNLRSQPAAGLILSIRSHSHAPAMKGRAEQSRAEQAAQLEGEIRCVNRPLGSLLGHHVARLQAKTAHRPWARPEVCSTCGFHRNRENMGWDHKHSWIPRAVRSPAGTPQHSLPLAPGHPPPLLTGTLPPRISKGRGQGPGHAEWGQQPLGMFKFVPHSPYKGNHRAGSLPSSAKPHYWSNRGEKKMSS